MKKIISSLLIVFLLTFYLPLNVWAVNCSEKQSCAGYDDKFHYCVSHGAYGGCVEAQCGEIPVQNCVGAIDKDGEKCALDLTGTHCQKKSTTEKEQKEKEGIPDFLKEQDTVSCGHIKNIPEYIPFITNLTINIFAIISVGMLVIMGTIDLFKGILSGKDDAMKKNQKAFFGRLTSAILLFVIVALTKLLVGFIANVTGGSVGIAECVDCFINNKCS